MQQLHAKIRTLTGKVQGDQATCEAFITAVKGITMKDIQLVSSYKLLNSAYWLSVKANVTA